MLPDGDACERGYPNIRIGRTRLSQKQKGPSHQNEGTLRASGMAGIEPTPPEKQEG
jgi:hypothetical protein